MSSISLRLVGDLDQDQRMANTSMRVSNDRYRPPHIELKAGQKEIKIGRLNSTNPPTYPIESCINKRMISRNHATIERLANGGFMLYDHSMNGTYVNYTRVSGGVSLKHGDIVCFGHLNGANLKPGEDVPPFFSDLKYQVYIGSVKETAALGTGDSSVERISSNKRQRQPSEGSLKSPHSISRDKKTAPPKASDRRGPVENSASDKSDLEESDDDQIDRLPKRKPMPSTSTGTSIKKQQFVSKNNGTKRHALSPSVKKSKLYSKKSRTKEIGSPESEGSESNEDDEGPARIAEEDQDECSARSCKKPAGSAIDWIQCDKCSKWYHQMCLNLTKKEAKVEVYYCPGCTKKR